MNSAPGARGIGGKVEDILEILWAPGRVFDRVREQKVGGYLLILALVTLALVIPTRGLVQPYLDANIDLQLQLQAARGRPVTPEAVAAARRIGGIGYLVSSTLMVPVGAVIGGVLLLIGAKLGGARLRYGQAMLIAALALVPRVLGTLVVAIEAALRDAPTGETLFALAIGPARFVDPATMSPAILGILATLDVFSVWQVVLYVIGVQQVARVDRTSGIVAAVVAWGLGTMASLLPTFFQ
jgi:hypothetical protein